MKKLSLCFLVALLSLNLLAQPAERHELSVFYGRLSNTELYGYGLEQLANVIATMAGGNKAHAVSIGTMGLSYFFRLSNLISMGVMGMYTHFFDANEVNNRIYYRYGAALAGVKLHWYEREWFRTYSMFAVGAMYHSNSTGKGFRVSGQATLLGMEFGKRFCGFLDLGIGDLSVAAAGLRIKF